MGKDVLKIEGEITHILPVESGTSKAGKEWKKQTFVINTGADFKPEVSFGLFGDEKIEMMEGYKEGQTVEVLFNISSNEWNGKWFQSIDCWKIQSVKAGSNNASNNASNDSEEDVPF